MWSAHTAGHSRVHHQTLTIAQLAEHLTVVDSRHQSVLGSIPSGEMYELCLRNGNLQTFCPARLHYQRPSGGYFWRLSVSGGYLEAICQWRLGPVEVICQFEMICMGGVPVLKRHFGGAGP